MIQHGGNLPAAARRNKRPLAAAKPQRLFRLRVSSPDLAGMWLGDGYALTLSGTPGRRYAVQSSTNLLHWTALTNDVFPFSVFDAQAAPQKFYRALLLP